MSNSKQICYLFTKKQRLTYKITSFKSSVDLNPVFNFAKKSEFYKMDYGNGNGNDVQDRKYDNDVRNSEMARTMFDLGELQVNDTGDDYDMTIERMFEFLKYNKNGHFEEHVDRKRYSNHTHSICVYPPQNVEGGELVVNKKVSIPMSKDAWITVIFPIDTVHTSKPVITGTKYLFKGTASVKYHKIKNIITTVTQTKQNKIKSMPKD